MEDYLGQAARWNWEGASYCTGGDAKNALNCFVKALRLLPLAADHQANYGGHPLAENLDQSVHLSTFPPLSFSRDQDENALSSSDASEEGEYASLFTKPFLFRAEAADAFVTPRALVLCTAIVEFNLALVAQLKGQDKANRKARQLYGHCMDHLQLCNGYHHESYSILTAVLNNQAMLSLELCDFTSIQPTLDALYVAVMACQRTREARLLNTDDVQSLLLNLMIFRDIQACPAA